MPRPKETAREQFRRGPATATGVVPSWELNPIGAAARIRNAGLPILTAEGTAEHFHAHLDVIVDREPIPVPAGIGFTLGADGKPDGISSLHTHDTSGRSPESISVWA